MCIRCVAMVGTILDEVTRDRDLPNDETIREAIAKMLDDTSQEGGDRARSEGTLMQMTPEFFRDNLAGQAVMVHPAMAKSVSLSVPASMFAFANYFQDAVFFREAGRWSARGERMPTLFEDGGAVIHIQ